MPQSVHNTPHQHPPQKLVGVWEGSRPGSTPLHAGVGCAHADSCSVCYLDAFTAALSESVERATRVWEGLSEAQRAALARESDAAGRGPLHYAAEAGAVALLQPLRSAGAELQQQCQSGSSALHTALRSQRLLTSQCLLDMGANCSLRDTTGRTPLHSAVECLDDGAAAAKLLRAVACESPIHARAQVGGELVTATELAMRRRTHDFADVISECAELWPHNPPPAKVTFEDPGSPADDASSDSGDAVSCEEQVEATDQSEAPPVLRALHRALQPMHDDLWDPANDCVDTVKLRLLLCEMGYGRSEGELSDAHVDALRCGLETGRLPVGGGTGSSNCKWVFRRLPPLSTVLWPESYGDAQRLITECVRECRVWELTDFSGGAGVCFVRGEEIPPALAAPLQEDGYDLESGPVFVAMRARRQCRVDVVVVVKEKAVSIHGDGRIYDYFLQMKGARALGVGDAIECALALGPDQLCAALRNAAQHNPSFRDCPHFVPNEVFASYRQQWGRCRWRDGMQTDPLLCLACVRRQWRLTALFAPHCRSGVAAAAISIAAVSGQSDVLATALLTHGALAAHDRWSAALHQEAVSSGCSSAGAGLLPPAAAAAAAGDRIGLFSLLGAGADPSEPRHFPPLLAAARAGRERTLRALISKKAEVTTTVLAACIVSTTLGEIHPSCVDLLVEASSFSAEPQTIADMLDFARALRSPAVPRLESALQTATAMHQAAEQARLMRKDPDTEEDDYVSSPPRLPAHTRELVSSVFLIDGLLPPTLHCGCAAAWAPDVRRHVMDCAAELAATQPQPPRPLSPAWRPLWRRLYGSLSALAKLLRRQTSTDRMTSGAERSAVWTAAIAVDRAAAQLSLARCGTEAEKGGHWHRRYTTAVEVSADAVAVGLLAEASMDDGLRTTRDVLHPDGHSNVTLYECDVFMRSFGSARVLCEVAQTKALRAVSSIGALAAEDLPAGSFVIVGSASLWDLHPLGGRSRVKKETAAEILDATMRRFEQRKEEKVDDGACKVHARISVLVVAHSGRVAEVLVDLHASSESAAHAAAIVGWRRWCAQGHERETLPELLSLIEPKAEVPCGTVL
eukprot:TRINITY_DN16664_c0_g4_i1.p1 TRINITY_DN16664_c0_g4~~TRINITY_DN16664_c0_g4_i1.p1  ORF type:complete len:1106 (+),score=256.10 TRINITY_DN16664_c0_g4_i1:72-3320(+)